jgi:hypothetical protein
MHLPEDYRGLLRPSSASEPSYPPDGVACRAYLKAQLPNCVRVTLLRGDHYEPDGSLRPSSRNCSSQSALVTFGPVRLSLPSQP